MVGVIYSQNQKMASFSSRMVEWSVDLCGCNVHFVWVWVTRAKEHCRWDGKVCGWIGVEEEVGWFENLLVVVEVDVCEGGVFFAEQGVNTL